MARRRATTAMTTRQVDVRGRRTEVQIQSQDIPVKDGFEDADTFFAAARSPVDKENQRHKLSRIRFSLGDDGSSVASKASLSKKEIAKNVRQRYMKALTNRGSLSPSDLSRVSTAPPSAKRTEEDIEEARAAQEHNDHRISTHVTSPESFPVDTSDDFPATQDDDDPEDTDDLVPPPPPESPESSINGDATTQDDVNFPTQIDDEDHENEGPGFEMTDPHTPDVSQATSKKKKKKRTEEISNQDASVHVKQSKKKKRKPQLFSPKGIPAGPREFQSIPVQEFTQEPEEGVRRSKRGRTKPLAYWKNERPIYGPNDFDDEQFSGVKNMPIVTQYSIAQPTPYKKRKTTAPAVVSSVKSQKGKKSENLVEEFDTAKLRKKYRYIDGEEANIWDEVNEIEVESKVVAYRTLMDERNLPLSKNRSKSEGTIVGRAAQAFNISNDDNDIHVGYIMGNLTLPPKGIKDPESVGSCSQTFTVVSCQPGSVEVAFSRPDEEHGKLNPRTAQRFLLEPGDLFRIPPGNCYRLENHSRNVDCFMTWTIIRPIQLRDGDTSSK